MPTSTFASSSNAVATDATFLTQTANSTLTAAQVLGLLSTGLMKVAASTGVVTAVTDSAGLAGCLSDETGGGAAVFANTPTLVTPVIGAATGTSVNLSGNCRAATFNVGASAGVDASIVIPAVATITVSKGIITAVV